MYCPRCKDDRSGGSFCKVCGAYLVATTSYDLTHHPNWRGTSYSGKPYCSICGKDADTAVGDLDLYGRPMGDEEGYLCGNCNRYDGLIKHGDTYETFMEKREIALDSIQQGKKLVEEKSRQPVQDEPGPGCVMWMTVLSFLAGLPVLCGVFSLLSLFELWGSVPSYAFLAMIVGSLFIVIGLFGLIKLFGDSAREQVGN